MIAALRRFMQFVSEDPVTGCWVWTGWRVTPKRIYGGFTSRRLTPRNWLAHRFAYTALIGPIPEGLQLDHLCCNTLCVNPDHLEPVSGHVNKLRGERATRDRCVNGHPFDEANTYWRKDVGFGRRMCKECGLARKRMSWARRREMKRAA